MPISFEGPRTGSSDPDGVKMHWTLPIGFALLALRYMLELVGFQNRFLLRDVIQDH